MSGECNAMGIQINVKLNVLKIEFFLCIPCFWRENSAWEHVLFVNIIFSVIVS